MAREDLLNRFGGRSDDPDFLIIGDLNAYAMEDPITHIEGAGYTDLVEHYVGVGAYSYVYYGQAGYLDHALANSSLAPQVRGLTIWHVNADEPRVQDYNEEYKSAGQVASTTGTRTDHLITIRLSWGWS